MAELATIARPYAEALMKAAANGNAANLAAEVRALADVAANSQLRQFADNPKILPEQVFDLLTGVARAPSGGSFGDASKNLLRAVIDNGRLAVLPEIAGLFDAMRAEDERLVKATITSATPLGDDDVARLRASLVKRFGRDVEVSTAVDPSLIGGAVIDAGDVGIDGSLKTKLARLGAALAN